MSPLYRRVLGERFALLPHQVQALHDLTAKSLWVGTADVERGRHPLSRLAGWITGLPRAGRGLPLSVTFEVRDGAEIWTRAFGHSVFRTVQYQEGGQLHERAGPVTFQFDLLVRDRALSLELRGMRVLGLPVPRRLLPTVATEEREIAGRYRFRVESSLPVAGLLVRYAGSLVRAADGTSA